MTFDEMRTVAITRAARQKQGEFDRLFEKVIVGRPTYENPLGKLPIDVEGARQIIKDWAHAQLEAEAVNEVDQRILKLIVSEQSLTQKDVTQ